MGYDPMGHLTSRDIRNWDHNTAEYQTYTNNRRQYWVYDADGRVLSGITDYYYDAAGKIYSFGANSDKTDQAFDGDGHRLKATVQSLDPETNQWTEEQVTYYIHSSVLGEVISEIGVTGAKERTFVHAPGNVLAIQYAAGGSPTVYWQHYEPSGGSYRASDPQGSSVGIAERDPMGANARAIKPPTWPAPSSPAKIEPYYGIPELNSTYRGCVADYVPTDCETAGHFFAIDFVKSAVIDPISASTTRRKPIWIPRDTSTGVLDPITNIWTIYSGPGGEYVWVEEPGEALETFIRPQTPPRVAGATPEQQQRFDAAWNDLQKRLHANNGNNSCAKLFGGLTKAEQALNNTVFTFDNLGSEPISSGNAQTEGNTTVINSVGQFMANNGRLPGSSVNYGSAATTQYIFQSSSRRQSLYAPVVFGETENASFILAHELGHRRKIYGKNNDDAQDLDKNTKNNRKIWEACFR